MDASDYKWDDVRVFAVTARSPSLRQAAEQLGTTHPTVRRRLSALEAATGVALFHRGVDGLHPTLDGQELLDAAVEVERSMHAFARRARAADSGARGPVSVTVTAPIAWLLARDFAEFAEAWPDIDLMVKTGSDFADLGQTQADVAIRVIVGDTKLDESLAGRRAAESAMATYGQDGATHWIASKPGPQWVKRTAFPDLPVLCVMGDVAVRHRLCRDGFGLAEIPCFIADPDIPRRSDPVGIADVWVLVHPDLRRNARLKLFRDAMVAAIQRHGPLLRGETATTVA